MLTTLTVDAVPGVAGRTATPVASRFIEALCIGVTDVPSALVNVTTDRLTTRRRLIVHLLKSSRALAPVFGSLDDADAVGTAADVSAGIVCKKIFDKQKFAQT